MKSFTEVTRETPKTNTWVIVVTLITGISDLLIGASEALGFSENLVAKIGLGAAIITLVINTLIANGVIKTLDVYAIKLFKS